MGLGRLDRSSVPMAARWVAVTSAQLLTLEIRSSNARRTSPVRPQMSALTSIVPLDGNASLVSSSSVLSSSVKLTFTLSFLPSSASTGT